MTRAHNKYVTLLGYLTSQQGIKNKESRNQGIKEFIPQTKKTDKTIIQYKF